MSNAIFRRWTVNIIVSTFLVMVFYLTSVQYANTTLGPYSRTALHHTPPRTLWSICDVRTFLSLSLTCGPQTARTWIQSTTLFGAPFNRWYTIVEVSPQWISWKKQSSQSGPSCHSVSLTAQLINGVVGFNAWLSSKEDTLNISCSEIHPCNVTIKIIAVFLWIFTVIFELVWIKYYQFIIVRFILDHPVYIYKPIANVHTGWAKKRPS